MNHKLDPSLATVVAAATVCSNNNSKQLALTQWDMHVRTSASMALARTADPSSPNKSIRRVLLWPGMGHLATTTMEAQQGITVLIILLYVWFGGTCLSQASRIIAEDEVVLSVPKIPVSYRKKNEDYSRAYT